MAAPELPVCLTVAGSDTSGGAGIQADLRTFGWCGTWGVSVVSGVTAQTPHELCAMAPVDTATVEHQLQALLAWQPPAAAKSGMLASAAVAHTVATALADAGVPWVVDPLLRAGAGGALSTDENALLHAYRSRVLPAAALVTPNVPEALAILGREPGPPLDRRTLAGALYDRFGAVLLKGGHDAERPEEDLLVCDDGAWVLAAPKLDPVQTHGTGCLLSAAITAHLAHGRSLLEAAAKAKAYVWHLLAHPRRLADGDHVLLPGDHCREDVVTVTCWSRRTAT